MTKGGLKAAISERERKVLLMLGMIVLLTGLAIMGKRLDIDSIAPLFVLMGLFGVSLGIVKQNRS